MSDKVELRNKLLSKLVKKASKLNESIKLFSKLDKKISLNQTGGNMHNIGIRLASIEHYAANLNTRLGDLNALVGHYDVTTNNIMRTLQGLRLGQFSHLTLMEYQNAQTIFNPANVGQIIPNVKRFIQLLLTNKRNSAFAAADNHYNGVYNVMKAHAACSIAENAIIIAAQTEAARGAANGASVRAAVQAAVQAAVPLIGIPANQTAVATAAVQALAAQAPQGGLAADAVTALQTAAAVVAATRIGQFNIGTHNLADTTLEPAGGIRLSDQEKRETLATLMEQAAIHSPAILA